MMKALLAAGGTGGHMFPAQSLSEELARQGWQCAMITDSRGRKHAGRIQADPIIEVKAASISPRKPVQALKGALQLAQGVRTAKVFIKAWQPDIVIGFGGYPSFPALKAAQSLGVPRIIHEQNAILGRVNRVFAKQAHTVASGFEALGKLPEGANHIPIGNPMRDVILQAATSKKAKAKSNLGLNILVMGGSLGANILSDVVPSAIQALPADLRSRLTVTQQATQTRLEKVEAIYSEVGLDATVATFFPDIEKYLTKADLIIARAGASSVSEIALMGKPSILVPLGIAMDDHQTANAQALERLDAAVILPELDFNQANLTKLLTERLNDADWLDRAGRSAAKLARPNAARDLAALVISAAGK